MYIGWLCRSVAAICLSGMPMAMAGALASSATACSSTDDNAAADKRLSEARQMRGYIESGNFSAASAMFDETMTAQVDAASFSQLTAVTDQLGAYEQELSHSESPGSLPSGRSAWNTELQCKYEKGSATFTVTIDDRDRVAGISVKKQ
jgi:hypothetical protein